MTTLFASIFSILIPVAVYLYAFVIRESPFGPHINAEMNILLLTSNVIGFGLALLALIRSGADVLDVSRPVLITVLLAVTGMFANDIAAQFILSFHVFSPGDLQVAIYAAFH